MQGARLITSWNGALINLDELEYFLPNSKFCESVEFMAQHSNEIMKLLGIKARG